MENPVALLLSVFQPMAHSVVLGAQSSREQIAFTT